MRFKGLLSQDFCFEMCTCFRDLTAHCHFTGVPFWADEIAQSSPGMSIEVAASTAIQKLYYTVG